MSSSLARACGGEGGARLDRPTASRDPPAGAGRGGGSPRPQRPPAARPSARGPRRAAAWLLTRADNPTRGVGQCWKRTGALDIDAAGRRCVRGAVSRPGRNANCPFPRTVPDCSPLQRACEPPTEVCLRMLAFQTAWSAGDCPTQPSTPAADGSRLPPTRQQCSQCVRTPQSCCQLPYTHGRSWLGWRLNCLPALRALRPPRCAVSGGPARSRSGLIRNNGGKCVVRRTVHVLAVLLANSASRQTGLQAATGASSLGPEPCSPFFLVCNNARRCRGSVGKRQRRARPLALPPPPGGGGRSGDRRQRRRGLGARGCGGHSGGAGCAARGGGAWR